MNNKLKDFDIVKAQAGEPVCTREGKDVRIISFDLKSEHSIVVVYQEEDFEEVATFTEKGRFVSDSNEHHLDLFMKPVKKTYWFNTYRSSKIYFGSIYLYPSIEEANKNKANTCREYIGTFSIEIEE